MSAFSDAGRPLRVIQCFRAPQGGLFRHVRDLAEGLAAHGIEVGAICDSTGHGELEAARLAALSRHCALGIVRTAMPRLPSPIDVLATRAVRDLAKRFDADIVHGHGAKGGAYARIAGPLAHVPALYTPHGGALHYRWRSPIGAAYLATEGLLRSRGDAILFESAFAQSVYRTRVGEPPALSQVIHNGLGPDEFEPVAMQRDPADILFIGELRALKGPFVLIEALAKLAARGPIASALIVGRGGEETRLRGAVPSALAGHVRFAAPMPAREAFARARLVVVPSLAESLPYIVLEAGAAGIPMIATRVGGIPEIFGPDANRLIAPGDAAALADAIDAALADPDRARAQAEALRARIGAEFRIEQMVERVVETYHAVRGANVARGKQ